MPLHLADCPCRDIGGLYSNSRGDIDYLCFLRGLAYCNRDTPCTAGDAIKHLHLQLDRFGFPKATAAFKRHDEPGTGELEWVPFVAALQDMFIELTSSQIVALMMR